MPLNPKPIGTLRGVRGSRVGDYTSLNRPYEVLIMGIAAPYPPKGPYDKPYLTTEPNTP